MKDRDTCQKVIVFLCIAVVVCICWLSRVYGEAGVEINETNFPDARFREYVKEFDENNNEFLSEEEIANVHSLHIEHERVESMKGIKFFTSLTDLICRDNSSLEELDMSGCTSLTTLNCSSNSLKKLDISGCTALKELYCYSNSLKDLDISECTALEKLICSDNKLTALDISKNKALKYLDCTNTQITTLDVHNCPMLVKLIKEYTRAMISDTGYGWSATGFESFNTKPEWFYKEVLCLCIDKSVAIIPAIEIKPEDMENVAINDVHFPDVPFRNKVSYYDEDQDGILSRNEREKIEIIDLSDVGPPDALEGVEYFTALKVLRFEYASLRSLDLSKNTALEELYCNSSRLSALDLSKNTALKALHCDGNKLTSLDLSNNTALKVLHCDRNNLTSLDLSNNTALEVLSCNANKLTALDISKHTALKSLECSDNQVSTLDVSRKEALKKIFCRNNQITALAVSDNTVLESLDCSNNQLISLDIRQNTALTELNCSDNQLTVLDTGNNADLLNLTCKHNQIKTLDVSKMASLKKLDCTQNQLKDLDVSHCPYLVTLIDKYRQCTGDETQNWDDSSEYYMDYPKFVLYTDLGVKITGEDKTGVPVDEQHFPDAGFRECIEEFDRNRNGLLSENDIDQRVHVVNIHHAVAVQVGTTGVLVLILVEVQDEVNHRIHVIHIHHAAAVHIAGNNNFLLNQIIEFIPRRSGLVNLQCTFRYINFTVLLVNVFKYHTPVHDILWVHNL